MKGSDLLKLIDTQRARVEKFADEEISFALIIGPEQISIDMLSVGVQDKGVFQQHLVSLLLTRLDGVKLDVKAQPFITNR